MVNKVVILLPVYTIFFNYQRYDYDRGKEKEKAAYVVKRTLTGVSDGRAMGNSRGA